MIYSFCNDDLSGFYLDILKDRLYTSATYSQERRSAQTVLYHILNHLVRLLAPILVFTSEEVFAAMPKDRGTQAVSSVHLLSWLGVPDDWKSQEAVDIEERYRRLIELRPFVMKALEDQRQAGLIGSSLDAKIRFRSASERDQRYLENLQGVLPSFFIVSQVGIEKVAEVENGVSAVFSKTEILIERADGRKCVRCWNYSAEVGKNQEHPQLCERCWPVVRWTAG
jgi:isoleucyl-tRNA synthetase